jgi:hypothetical protein
VTDTDWFCYVAFPTDCRCVAAVCVDEPEHRKDVAKFTAEQVRHGHILERMRGDAFRALSFHCPEHPDGRWP